MSGRSTYQKGQKGGFRGGERIYQGRGNSGGDRGFDNKHLFNRSKQSKSFEDLHSFELGSPMEVSRTVLEELLKALIPGSTARMVITLSEEPKSIAPARPDLTEFENDPDNDLLRTASIKIWQEEVRSFWRDVRTVRDSLISNCTADLLRWLIDEKGDGDEIMFLINDSENIVPISLLIDWIYEGSMHKEGYSKTERLKPLLDKVFRLSHSGQFAGQSLQNFMEIFEQVYDQIRILDPTKVPDELEQASNFFTGLNASEYTELKETRAKYEREYPWDEPEQIREMFQVFNRTIHSVDLKSSCLVAQRFRPTWQNASRVQYQKLEKRLDDRDIVEARVALLPDGGGVGKEAKTCLLCDRPGHEISKCFHLRDAKHHIKEKLDAKLQNTKAKPKSTKGGNRVEFANPLLENDGDSLHHFNFSTVLLDRLAAHIAELSTDEVSFAIREFTQKNPTAVLALFDTCSTITVFKDRNLVSNLEKCRALNVITCGGVFSGIDSVGTSTFLPGPVYLHNGGMFNVISAFDVFHNPELFRASTKLMGEWDIIHRATNICIPIRWFKRVLIADITQISKA